MRLRTTDPWIKHLLFSLHDLDCLDCCGLLITINVATTLVPIEQSGMLGRKLDIPRWCFTSSAISNVQDMGKELYGTQYLRVSF